MDQVYTSKIDAWLGVILVAVIGYCIWIFFSALLSGNSARLMSALFTLALGAGFPLWLMLSTKYILSNSELLIKSGPFKWTVPVKSINRVTPTSNPLSSPALSLDRLRIEYDQGRAIMISPKLKTEFLEDLEARRRQVD